MTQLWEPGTQYNNGDVVEYNGHRYKIIQPHRSQGDWTPDATPALWGRMQDGDGGHHGHHQEHQGNQNQYNQQQPQQPYQGNQGNQGGYPQDKPSQGGQDYQPNKEESKLEEAKDWLGEHKKELGIAGGLLAGAGLLGAAGLAYKHHNDKKEEEEQGKRQYDY